MLNLNYTPVAPDAPPVGCGACGLRPAIADTGGGVYLCARCLLRQATSLLDAAAYIVGWVEQHDPDAAAL